MTRRTDALSARREKRRRDVRKNVRRVRARTVAATEAQNHSDAVGGNSGKMPVQLDIMEHLPRPSVMTTKNPSGRSRLLIQSKLRKNPGAVLIVVLWAAHHITARAAARTQTFALTFPSP
jgi:hypothetical protein